MRRQRKKGAVPICRNGPEGAAHKWGLSPFPRSVWGGTYHAIATRLLHRFGKAVGLRPDFAVHDRADSEDLMNVVRTDLNLAKTDKRFPKCPAGIRGFENVARCAGSEKGDRHHLCAAPSGPFRQMVPVPFFPESRKVV